MNNKKDKVLKKTLPLKSIIAALLFFTAGIIITVSITGKSDNNTAAIGPNESLASNLPVAQKKQQYQTLFASNGTVRIPVSELVSGQAKYFTFEDLEKTVKFFAMKSSDGVYRTAFDACDVCYRNKKGYSQRGNLMICNNCGQQFQSTKINEIRGGCNPSPLERKVVGNFIEIKVSSISDGLMYF